MPVNFTDDDRGLCDRCQQPSFNDRFIQVRKPIIEHDNNDNFHYSSLVQEWCFDCIMGEIFDKWSDKFRQTSK